jgi:hypothetical protein
VRLARTAPALWQKAPDTVERWRETGDARSSGWWREWQDILAPVRGIQPGVVSGDT